ncbi:hypothetical protein K458DRAFT_413754 [Lentithecium fluviatile CBS 122367]|uniref:Uncharacterized protein n=1 Tax=Lentithecium fluviatile CBS 122367 TaxID=1168545 RepID=A0A6G1JG81_9PLEO|nr:hypothetical protein K458DRAFT_413754 [Lentithecium fluviatile CBS 122367]
MSSQPAKPITAPSTSLSSPPPLAVPPPPRLCVISKPLAIKSPGSRVVVELELEPELELLPDVLELLADDDDLVVDALLLAGVFGMVLVFPSIMSAVPLGSREYVVPDTTMDSPGFSVWPSPITNSVVPSRTVAEYVLPLIVRAAAAVMGPWPKVDVWPLITTTEPDADTGSE